MCMCGLFATYSRMLHGLSFVRACFVRVCLCAHVVYNVFVCFRMCCVVLHVLFYVGA